MIRALKRLGAWTKKKTRKKKRDEPLDGAPAGPHCSSCSCSSNAAPHLRPSAPPLPPPWLDFRQISGPVPTDETRARWLPSMGAGPPRDTTPLLAPAPGTSSTSYQQYLEADPVLGLPIGRPAPAGHGYQAGGCSGGAGTWLRRCIFGCFGYRN